MLSIKYTPKWIKVLAVIAAMILPAAWMTFQIMSAQTIKCRVCMDYRGSKDCRDAEGPTKEECQRTATDNACALISSGMTESIQCSNTPPSGVTFN